MRGCMCWDVDVYTKAREGQRVASAEKKLSSWQRQAGGMFQSVGKRESDQLGTNVRERGLGGVTGLQGIPVYTSPLTLRPNTLPFACTRRFPSGASTCHLTLN
jgi:hypothetical protein